jgi:hypothetical protein
MTGIERRAAKEYSQFAGDEELNSVGAHSGTEIIRED